jgi:hypothetical protein
VITNPRGLLTQCYDGAVNDNCETGLILANIRPSEMATRLLWSSKRELSILVDGKP